MKAVKALYTNGCSVVFSLDNGRYAIASVDKEHKKKIYISDYADSFLKFGYFGDVSNVTEEQIEIARNTVNNPEEILDLQVNRI